MAVAPSPDLHDSLPMTMPHQGRVLVVDDEVPILDLVRGYLERDGFEVDTAADGPAGLAAVRAGNPDVVVLDVMLPGIDGIEVCRQLRTFSNAYVLMLTARGEEIDRIMGLTVGADDYLVKPFSPKVLVARVKAVLRRTGVESDEGQTGLLTLRGISIDPKAREVRVEGRVIELTGTEFELLRVLGEHPGWVYTREELLESVWGYSYLGDSRLVDVHIANLRKKIGDDPADPHFIRTVRGVGYKFQVPTTDPSTQQGGDT
jgi:DNA-binding response OmpR family regulator